MNHSIVNCKQVTIAVTDLPRKAAPLFFSLPSAPEGTLPGAGGTLLPQFFGTSVNPIPISGADYAHHITTAPPHFLELPPPLTSESIYFH